MTKGLFLGAVLLVGLHGSSSADDVPAKLIFEMIAARTAKVVDTKTGKESPVIFANTRPANCPDAFYWTDRKTVEPCSGGAKYQPDSAAIREDRKAIIELIKIPNDPGPNESNTEKGT
jgi:hypothetical protein